MGRYRKDRDYYPSDFVHPNLSVDFITAHASKGLECDHVILPRMTSENLGFPSRIADDPVLALAMPDGDEFAFSEERRLFYVALTRAKRSVRLITLTKRESVFVTELVKDYGLAIQNLDGEDRQEELCPECGQGFLTTRKGKYGLFHGCTAFPRCKYTRNIASTNTGLKASRARYRFTPN
jgi:DNA helicase-4